MVVRQWCRRRVGGKCLEDRAASDGTANGDWRPAIVAVGYGLTAMAVVVGIVAAWQW